MPTRELRSRARHRELDFWCTLASVAVQPCSEGYEAALDRLPAAHALALRLTEAGEPDEAICSRLDIDPDGLEPLLDIARRKLRRELSRE